MNISTTFLNALKHTSSGVEGQRSPEILLGQIYKVSLEEKGFLLPLAGGEFRLSDLFERSVRKQISTTGYFDDFR